MALVVPSTTAQFSKAIDPAVRKFFVEAYRDEDPGVEKILRVGDQIDYNQQEQVIAGLGNLQPVPEAGVYPVDAPLQSFGTTYTPVKYGSVIEISDELIRYDKSAVTKATELSRLRARSAANTVGIEGAGLFNNGFDTAFTSYGDGKPLFSTVHQRADGVGNLSNASATGIPLTEANLETAIIAFRQQLDDRGQPIMQFPDTLVVPLALQKEALIITKSQLRSATGDNDANVYSLTEYTGGGMKVMTWRYLDSQLGGSDTAWFLLDSKNHKVSWKWGVRPEIGARNDTEGYSQDLITWKVRLEASKGWTDYRGSWGSKGDNQAYAS